MGRFGVNMVQTLSTNDQNDIFLNVQGNIEVAQSLDGVLKACETATYAQLGEMTQNLGIPNFQTIWVGSPNYPLFQSYLRQTLLNVQGVTDVTDLQIFPDNNTLRYRATIQSQFGSAEIIV
jgi:hypothetical protein